jgi:hypothetical protein
MQWFKHHNNFRNTAKLKHIEKVLGDAGVAAVYRLYEVFTERFGVDDNFTGSITLSAPFSEQWLASEILRRPWHQESNPYGDEPKVEDVLYLLGECEQAGIVQLTREVATIARVDPKTGETKESGDTKTWTTVTIPGFAELADVYQHRREVKRNRALETTR